MQHALEQYNEKRTTMAESIKHVKDLAYPILVFCPEPGFKPSFFRKMKWNQPPGAEKFIWKYSGYAKFLKNVSSFPDEYENMSYVYGLDWTISFFPLSQLGER